MRVHVPSFEEFLRGRPFDPVTVELMKEAWNASAKAADCFLEDVESHNYHIADALRVD